MPEGFHHEDTRIKEDTIRALLEHSPSAVFLHDTKATFVDVNRAGEELFGYDRVELLQMRPVDLCPPTQADGIPSKESAARRHAEVLAGNPQNFEWTYLTASGTLLPAYVRLKLLKVGGENLIVASVTDLTELKQAHLEAERSSQWFREIFDCSGDAIMVVDPERDRIVDANPRARTMLGYTRDEILGMSLAAIHPDEMPRLKSFATSVFDDGVGWTDEFTCLTKGGQRIPSEITGSVVPVDGRPHLMAIVRDISERRRSEEMRLGRVRRHQEVVLDAVADAVLGVSPEGMITFANPAAHRLLSAPKLVGRPCTVLTAPPGAGTRPDECADALALRKPHSQAIETTFFRSNGLRFPVEFMSTPAIEDDEITGWVVSFRDVSLRQRLEAEVRQATKMEAVGRLAGGIAHDFNNILTVIIGCAELLEEFALPDAQGDLKALLNAAESGAKLTKRLLQVSRDEPEEASLVDINRLVTRMLPLLERGLGELIRISVNLDPALPPVLCNPGHVEQIVMNLAVNAKHAMPDGGALTIDTACLHAPVPEAVGLSTGPHAAMTIADTGSGMDEETKSKVFEPFFTTKSDQGGSGLGLSTVYGIVKQWNGSITLESAENEGATFRILFPAAESQITPQTPLDHSTESSSSTP